jgi:hypothetical protein
MSAPLRHVTSGTTLYGAWWRRSRHSTGANNCVETARLAVGPHAGLLAVRDSKNTEGPAVLFPPGAWQSFVDALR